MLTTDQVLKNSPTEGPQFRSRNCMPNGWRSELLLNFGDNPGAHCSATLADRKTLAFFHRNR